MSLVFYPHTDDVRKGSLEEQIEVLMEAAEEYKSIVLDAEAHAEPKKSGDHRSVPRDIRFAYNWEAIAYVLHKVRDMPEGSSEVKLQKAELLKKMAEIYEVLRAAKMSKLEAVRLAIINEANQLSSGTSQVA